MRLTLYDAIISRLSQIIIKDGQPCYPAATKPTEGGTAPEMSCQRAQNRLQVMPSAADIAHSEKAILCFDLWNENIANLTKQRTFRTPGVFIEFLPVQWRQLGCRVRQAETSFRLHVITVTLATSNSDYTDEAHYRFRLIRAMEEALAGMTGVDKKRGISFNHCTLAESWTDHNHEQVCEDVETWKRACHRPFGGIQQRLRLHPRRCNP